MKDIYSVEQRQGRDFSESGVGRLRVTSVERFEGLWLARGTTVSLSGEELELSELAGSREEAIDLLGQKVWLEVLGTTKFAISLDMTILELATIALRALRSGELGRGNRIQTVNMYERQLPFLAGERDFPAFGHVRLRDCTAQAVQAWLSMVAAEYATTARHLKILLMHCFDLVIRQGLMEWGSNPARRAQLPSMRAEEPVALSEDDFQALLVQILEWEHSGKRTDLYGIVCCFMATGIRPGELPALLWEEVDLESTPATMIVSGCAVLQDGVLVRQPETKTAAGYREIVLPEWFADMLRERRARRQPDCPYVFASNTGTMLSMNNIGNRFRQARGERFRHVKLKSFRSTVATRIAEIRGAEEAARHLGHTSPSITGRHYIKRPKETGNHNDILGRYAPPPATFGKDLKKAS